MNFLHKLKTSDLITNGTFCFTECGVPDPFYLVSCDVSGVCWSTLFSAGSQDVVQSHVTTQHHHTSAFL